MIDIPKLINTMPVKIFVRRAHEHGFTDSDILWVLCELKKDFLIEARKPGLHPGLILDILKKKAESMVVARRIVKEVCKELGIKTERI